MLRWTGIAFCWTGLAFGHGLSGLGGGPLGVPKPGGTSKLAVFALASVGGDFLGTAPKSALEGIAFFAGGQPNSLVFGGGPGGAVSIPQATWHSVGKGTEVQ